MTVSLQRSDIEQAIKEYDEDGATVLRGVISPEWISRLASTVDAMLDSGRGIDFSRPGEGRFFNDIFSWMREPEFKAFIFESSLPEIAGKIMRSKGVRFFYDQLLVKEPGTAKRTPWHQDLPYWPVTGEQILSIWVPIDAASSENGVVTYVRGSHRWNRFFAMETWSDNAGAGHGAQPEGAEDLYDTPEKTGAWRSIPDIVSHPENYEFISWKVEPGDVIIHHPLTVHGGPGNLSSNMRRRAIATRWLGDDARWDDSRPNFMHRLKGNDAFPYPKLDRGDVLADPLFPAVWGSA